MCNGAVKDEVSSLGSVPDHLKTQEMCNEVVHREPYTLRHVPDHLKTEEMCEKAFEKHSRSLKYVSDWFVTDQKISQVMKFKLVGIVCLMILLNDLKVIKKERFEKPQ